MYRVLQRNLPTKEPVKMRFILRLYLFKIVASSRQEWFKKGYVLRINLHFRAGLILGCGLHELDSCFYLKQLFRTNSHVSDVIAQGDRCDLDIVPGCTDPESPFYDPLANVDDGSCPYIVDEEN